MQNLLAPELMPFNRQDTTGLIAGPDRLRAVIAWTRPVAGNRSSDSFSGNQCQALPGHTATSPNMRQSSPVSYPGDIGTYTVDTALTNGSIKVQ